MGEEGEIQSINTGEKERLEYNEDTNATRVYTKMYEPNGSDGKFFQFEAIIE